MKRAAVLLLLLSSLTASGEKGLLGYYREPVLHGKTLVFQAEGDLWRVGASGGTAQRLTTHLERERLPVISPDGRTIAFAASYEGPTEIYTMPVEGGKPERLTHEGVSNRRTPYPVSWKSPSELVYATWFFASRDTMQLATKNLETMETTVIPLEQASDGVFTPNGKTIFFTRLPRQSSVAKRYTGGLIEKLWRFDLGAEEAVPLAADHEGTSRSPMLWKKRLYFVTDRDGTMNLWSMNLDGREIRQHTRFAGWDVHSPSLHRGRIAFRNQADLWIYNISKDTTRKIPIRLASDFDQMRERWISNPLRYLESYGLSDDGKKVVLTVRGRSFVAPVKAGRLVRIPQAPRTRYRQARFLPKSEDVYLLSDQTGEFEFWQHSSRGDGKGRQLTKGSEARLYNGAPSPDGKLLAFTDRNHVLWLRDLATGTTRKVARSREGKRWDSIDLDWSPDSRWIAFVDYDPNTMRRIHLYDTRGDQPPVPVTTDRLDSFSPAFSRDGKWLYFLSDRTFRSVQNTPWGARQPEPLLDKTTSIFLLDLVGGQKSPFDPDLETDSSPVEKKAETPPEEVPAAEGEDEKPADEKKPALGVKPEGLASRLHVVPLDAGNYNHLAVAGKNLYFFRSTLELKRDHDLLTYPITKDSDRRKLIAIASAVRGYRISGDGTTCLVRKGDGLHVFPANGRAPANLTSAQVSLSSLALNVRPADEWRQMFTDAWRLHRDYFYDPNMHGVDWNAVRRKHEQLLPRLTSRWDLDDLIAQMVGELSALHTDVRPGDVRNATDGASHGFLGARLSRLKTGYRVEHLYPTDPDYPGELSPLLKPGAGVAEGDVIVSVNAVPALSAPDIGLLLRNTAGRQVLLEIRRPGTAGVRKTIVKPLNLTEFRNLKVSSWEFTRRLETEERGKGEIGYFHMRAMAASSYAEFVKGYYPVYNRKGLVIDMRQNYGGNIDSWILNRLNRKPWMFWKTRTGRPFANMQFAFNGHMVVLIDAYTISDAEAFAEGFRRLGLGPLVGTKTWGGGIWLRGHTKLMDGGLPRTPETGMYSPDGQWLVEGTGVLPDIEVDNLPHQAFLGKDAQLEAAIAYLKKKIAEAPPVIPPPPPHPDKSFDYPEGE